MFALFYGRSYVLAAAVTVVGCATPSGTRPHRSDPSARSIDEITLEEIKSVLPRTSSAADIIRTVRPGLVMPRYPVVARSANGDAMLRANMIQVYVDNVPYGGVETLALIPAASVRSVRRLTPLDAVTRFGGSHLNGVIVVTTGVPDRTR